MKVSSFMSAKVISAKPDAGIRETFFYMRQNRVCYLPVVEDDGSLVGIISDRDLRRPDWVDEDMDISHVYQLDDNLKVLDLMTSNVIPIHTYDNIKKAVEIDTTPHPINIGTGQECSISILAHKIADMMNFKGDIVFNSNGMDGQPRRCLDTSRAAKVLGFEARTGLDRGLHDTVSWYYKNKEKFTSYFKDIG